MPQHERQGMIVLMSGSARVRKAASAWPMIVPPVAAVVLLAAWNASLGMGAALFIALVLVAVVLAAVHHAEVVAHRVGEPFGSLILAVAVTVIEVGLIVALMLSSPSNTATLARDTVFAAVMITLNGIIGLSILFGVSRRGTTQFNAEGSGAALASVAALSTLSLVLPTFTSSQPGPQFSGPQLAFAAIASLTIYAAFILTQTIAHRDFFLPVSSPDSRASAEPGSGFPHADGAMAEVRGDQPHAEPPTTRHALISVAWLLLSLVAVVGLAKVESPFIEGFVIDAGLPQSVVGVAIALIILLPESLAAVRAARLQRLQTSMNLAFGSALASIGLTIPVIAVATIWLDGPLLLGLGSTQIVLLALTLFVSALTIIPGRVTRLQGAMHLTILAAFLVLSLNP